MNKWLILKERIGKQREVLKETVQREKEIYNCLTPLKEFLDSQSNGKPNLKILDTLPNEVLDKKEVMNLKNTIWKESYDKIQIIYSRILKILNIKYKEIIASEGKRKNYIDIMEKIIFLYNKAYSIITDEGIIEVCNQELINAIIDVITELDMNDELISQMINELKQKNEELLKNINSKKDNEEPAKTTEKVTPNNHQKNTSDDIILKGTNIIRNVKDIIDYFDEILKHYSKLNIDAEKYANIYARIEYLKEAIYDYNESLEIYFNSNKTDSEAVNYFYNELNNNYDKLLNEKVNLEMKQRFMNACDEFYVPIDKIKNLIVFIPVDGSEISNMEESLNDDENINPSDYNTIKSCLNRLSLGYEDSLETHRSKSEKYSDDFIKKYHVKGIKQSKCRLMYSRYSTTLKQRYPEFTENPNVIFVFNAGYGSLDGSQKRDLYETGLDECFKYSSQIEEIKNLLNINWSEISPNEAEIYDKKIKKLFELQKKKMNHFLNTCIMKQNFDVKRGK